MSRLQELLDRAKERVTEAQITLDNLKFRTISVTSEDIARKDLADAQAAVAEAQTKVDEQQQVVTTATGSVTATRQAALEAEQAVENARTALVAAAEANLAQAAAYTLSQVERYKVTVTAVDSNGVVTTPTVGGTDKGEVTENAVASTTYYIVVPEEEKTSGPENNQQADSMEDNFTNGLGDTTASNYTLVDPTTGTESVTVTTDEGTYTVNSDNGDISFTPADGFVGTAKGISVSAVVAFTGDDGSTVSVKSTTTYTPTVYAVKGIDDTTTGKQGETQQSLPGN